ncbi:MAG: S8 family serine peptidase, partial [Ignavibacterium sp.]
PIAGDEYYWAGDKKVNITKDLSTLIVVFKKDRLSLNAMNRYESNKEISKATISGDNKMVVLEYRQEQIKSSTELVQTLGLKIDDLEWISFGYKEYEVPLRPTNRISFKLKSNISEKTIYELIKGKAEFDYTHFGTIMVKVNNAYGDVVSLANEIYESGITEYSLPDFIANIERHEDPLYSAQYFLNHTKQIGIGGVPDSDIDAPEAWDITKGSSSIKVAVIDDGLEVHDDLKDEYGISKIIGGYTPHGGGSGIPWLSTDGHGEACGGIIAASHNNLNTRGVAPNVKLITVNIFKTGTTNQEIADGINWAWQNGADVLSNSWGFSCNANGYYVPQIADAINNARTNGRSGKGCVVVFSAGNNYPVDKCGYGPAGYVGFPSTVTGVLCVSAINKYGSISSYSSRGSRIDIAAIGGESDIRTLDRMGSNGYNSGSDMNDFGGTSAACPQVSGVAALILSLNPSLTEQQVKDLITQNATDIGTAGKDNLYGWGRIDAAKTLAKLKSQMNSDFTFLESNASIVRTNESVVIQFLSAPRPDLSASYYICDRYNVQVSSNGYAEAPIGWFVNSEGYSPDNSNYASSWVNKTINSNSISLQTYFYYIKYDILGQTINKWAPYDPTGKFIVLGKPLVAPVIASMTQSPVPIYKGTYGYVYCNLSQGNGNLTYNWFSYDQPSYVSIVPEGYRCKIIYHNTESMPPIDAPTWNFGCTVSNAPGAGWSDTETFVPSLNSDPNGCPTLAFDNRGTLISENPLLITSMSNPGKDVTDYYLINTPLTPVNNKLNLTIHEPQTEHTWFDNVSLLETRANPDETIVVNDEGQVINYKGVLPARILLNGETDITQNLLELDSLSVELNPGDKLTISRNAVEGDGDVVLGGEEPIIVKDRPSLIMNILTESKVEDSEEIKTESIPITNFFLRPNKSIISKRLRNLPTGTIEITVNKKLTLDYFVFVSDLRTARTRELPLVSAVHNVNGDVKTKLTGIDQNYSEMYPTQRIDLSFSTTINSGNRAYILKTVGRYETDTTFVTKLNNLAKLNEQPIIPTENKLYDNYPNPFNPTTIIKYSLKDDGKVSLKIFNSLGEEVRTLVNEIK